MSDTTSQQRSDRDVRLAADRLLVRVAGHGGVWVVVLALASLTSAGAALALPAVLGRAVDAVVAGDSTGTWVIWCALVMTVLVAADALDNLAAGAAIARSTAWLRHATLRHFLALGSRPARRLPSGEITTRLVGNAAEAGRVAPDVVRSLASVVPAVGGIVALAFIHPWLCLTFLAGMPALLLFVRSFARDASDVIGRYFAVQGTIAARLVDALAGARTIAAAATADREAARVLAPLPDLHRHGVGMWRTQMRLTTQDTVVVSLLEVAVLAVAGALVARGQISPGQMLAASGYVLLAGSVSGVAGGMTTMVRSRAAASRVGEVLDELPVRHGTTSAPEGPGRLEFRGVVAVAGERRVFDGIDLAVPAGSLVAIVGASGSGKSLLAALAGRLVDPDEGEVLLDGVALPELRREELRREIGYGFERPVLIGDTLADAIAFGGHAPPPAAIAAAAGAARADEFIRRLPAGYDTRLADAPMSGGEVQRVGLARTFAHARRVVVLDDVAASLDTVTEHHIAAVLTGELADRTRMIVAHRASTAARADFVVWLDGGGIRAQAPHAQLWRDPHYRALFEARADGDSPPVATVASNGDRS
ncbi:MAG: ATP-binding cassette, subfamily bacterial RamA/AmfB [Solirubrobacteraceae bacterium]|nr:ATP-binding cassette, subfamily bacterial RamA/AmfB [Solirubrobacteraceae bacterium]